MSADPSKRMTQLGSALALLKSLREEEQAAESQWRDAVSKRGIAEKLVDLRDRQLHAELQGWQVRLALDDCHHWSVDIIDPASAAEMQAEGQEQEKRLAAERAERESAEREETDASVLQ